MKIIKKTFIGLLLIIISGCGNINVKENLVTLSPEYFREPDSDDFVSAKEIQYENLISAYKQIGGEDSHGFSQTENVLPDFMTKDALVTKLVRTFYNFHIDGKKSNIDITLSDLENFTNMTKLHYGAENVVDDNSKAHKIIKSYLIKYYSDTKEGFVDREGTVYLRPEIKTSIGNDMITTVALITLEGLMDSIFNNIPVFMVKDECEFNILTVGSKQKQEEKIKEFKGNVASNPKKCNFLMVHWVHVPDNKWTISGLDDKGVFKTIAPSEKLVEEAKKNPSDKSKIIKLAGKTLNRTIPSAKYQTLKGNKPTVFDLGFTNEESLVEKGKEGITKYELKAIRYLSGLASDQSKALSGIVVRTFGDLEIGFVIGGHFSFGDNDTLAKLIDTTFEIIAKRLVEAVTYHGFTGLTIPLNTNSSQYLTVKNNNNGAVQLIHDIEEIEN